MAGTGSSSERGAATGQVAADFYRVLGVGYSATPKEIARAYRELMKAAHPDRQPPQFRPAAEERAKDLNRAYSVLSQPASRRAHDIEIKAAAVQERVMSSYFGGMGMPGGAADPLGEALRRERTAAERGEVREADRGAMVSVLLVFGGVTLALIAWLILWAALSWMAQAVF